MKSSIEWRLGGIRFILSMMTHRSRSFQQSSIRRYFCSDRILKNTQTVWSLVECTIIGYSIWLSYVSKMLSGPISSRQAGAVDAFLVFFCVIHSQVEKCSMCSFIDIRFESSFAVTVMLSHRNSNVDGRRNKTKMNRKDLYVRTLYLKFS